MSQNVACPLPATRVSQVVTHSVVVDPQSFRTKQSY